MSQRVVFAVLRSMMARVATHGLPDARILAVVGLSQPVFRALRWMLQGPVLRLGLDPALPRASWPRSLRCPVTGQSVPLDCRPAAPGRLHAGAATVLNPQRANAQGSVTALMQSRRDGRRWYALTAGHVLAAGGEAGLGERQRIALQGHAATFNARIEEFEPSFYTLGVDAALDAGLAMLDADQAQALLDAGLEQPTGTADLYGGGMDVTVRGVSGPRPAVTVHDQACCWMGLNGMARCDYRLLDAVVYQCDAGTEGGDSGAALWDGLDRLVGMHIGSAPEGMDGNAVAMPILQVLQKWPALRVATRRAPAPVAPVLPAAPAPVTPSPAPPASVTQSIDVLARTLWGEARGEPDPRASMSAVACVVLNRVRRRTYWGRGVTDVCLKPYQFSCWNANDRNRPLLGRVDVTDRTFALALKIARDAIDNQLSDLTLGATHYHARSMARPPSWARGRIPCATVGNHLFFNDIP